MFGIIHGWPFWPVWLATHPLPYGQILVWFVEQICHHYQATFKESCVIDPTIWLIFTAVVLVMVSYWIKPLAKRIHCIKYIYNYHTPVRCVWILFIYVANITLDRALNLFNHSNLSHFLTREIMRGLLNYIRMLFDIPCAPVIIEYEPLLY